MRPLFSLVKKELLYMRAYPLDLFNYAISPALLVAPYLLVAKLFGFDQELLDSVAIGLILWYWLSILMWEVGAGVMEEMEEGVWESLLISPVSIPAILGAKALSAVLLNLYITGGMVGWFFLFGVSLPIPWPQFLGILILGGMGIIGFMLVLAGLTLRFKTLGVVGDVIQTSLGLLSGMTAPAKLLPRPLWFASRAIPLAYAIEAARALLSGAGFGKETLLLLGLGLAYGLLGRWFLGRSERGMKTAGTTGEF